MRGRGVFHSVPWLRAGHIAPESAISHQGAVGQPLTSSADTISSALAVMAITWAIAAVIALYMPFESLALLRAIIVAVGFLGIHTIYINLAIREDVSGSD